MRYLAALFLLPIHAWALSTDDSLRVELPTEQLFIYTDKDIYAPGEDIWFTTLLFDETYRVSTESAHVFALLTNQDTEEHLLSGMYQGEGNIHGHFRLPSSAKDGSYQLSVASQYSILDEHKKPSTRIIEVRGNALDPARAVISYNPHTFGGRIKLETIDGYPITDQRLDMLAVSKGQTVDKIKLKTNEKGESDFLFAKLEKATQIVIEGAYLNREFRLVEYPPVSWRKPKLRIWLPSKQWSTTHSNQVFAAVLDADSNFLAVDHIEFAEGIEGIPSSMTPLSAGIWTGFITGPGSDVIDIRCRELGLKASLRRPDLSHPTLDVQSRSDSTWVIQVDRSPSDASEMGIEHSKFRRVVSLKGTDNSDSYLLKTPSLQNGPVAFELRSPNDSVRVRAVQYANANPLEIQLEGMESSYGTDDSVHLQLRLLDEVGEPVAGTFIVSIFDQLYRKGTLNQNMWTDLRIRAYRHYPFTWPWMKSSHRSTLLRALFTDEYVVPTPSRSTLPIDELNRRVKTAYEGELKRASKAAEEAGLLLFYSNGISHLDVEAGKFNISTSTLANANGHSIGLSLTRAEEHAEIVVRSGIDLLMEKYHRQEVPYAIQDQANEEIPYHLLMDKVIELAELTINGQRVDEHGTGLFAAPGEDYVCPFFVLNCVNHAYGMPPVRGNLYFLNSGKQIRYRGTEEENKSAIRLIDSFYPVPDFEEISARSKKFPLFFQKQNVLFWSPELPTDSNGMVQIRTKTSGVRSFFTVRVHAYTEDGRVESKEFEMRVTEP